LDGISIAKEGQKVVRVLGQNKEIQEIKIKQMNGVATSDFDGQGWS